MVRVLGTTRIHLRCARCAAVVGWTWVVRYTSYKYTRYVHLCSECGNVVKIETAFKPLELKRSSPSDDEGDRSDPVKPADCSIPR